jgi:hypothetical protein
MMAFGRRSVLCLAIVAAALWACRRSVPGSASTASPTTPRQDAARSVKAGPLLAGADTYGVLAGVLTFSDPGVTGFATELRKDRELRDVLVQRGVPEANLVLLLDAEARESAVSAALTKTATRAPRGSTLLFYYAGHGARDRTGRPYFVAHDTTGQKNALFIDRIATAIDASFHGKRVVLMADCCYSGTLKAVAEKLPRLDSIVLTSADASNLSTSNWTFTQTVIDGLSGDAFADANGDGRVTLGELDHEVGQAMKYREAQRHGFFVRGVALDEQIARARGRPPTERKGRFAAGDYVRVHARRMARVVEPGESDSVVRFYDYNQARDERVKNTALAPSTFRRFPRDSAIRVLWGGKTWDARILKTDGDFHFITYPGWPSYWDEWVLSDRIVTEDAVRKASAEKVEVEWRGHWYPAVILQQARSRYLVHYVGYDSSWDEWVTPDRVRH